MNIWPFLLFIPIIINNLYSCPINNNSWLCNSLWSDNPAIVREQLNPYWVSSENHTVTLYNLTSNSIWLLSHNTLWPGIVWKNLKIGDELKYSSNEIVRVFYVKEIYNFTLENPNDPFSNWVDENGTTYNTFEIIKRFDKQNNLILQTCTSKGRLILISKE
jgi:hypothetical protein